MAAQFPSIQSFFKPELSNTPKQMTSLAAIGDGFTLAEVETKAHMPRPDWKPRDHYHFMQICDLAPGPRLVCVKGRVVSFHDKQPLRQMPYGSSRVLVRDDTGTLLVRLWYAKYDYQLRLGQLVSVWMTHISSVESQWDGPVVASHATTLHPERDSKCCFTIETDADDGSLYRSPLGSSDGHQLEGLMTLKNYLEGGHDIEGTKVLVCVKSVGGRKTITTKKGEALDILQVFIFDDTHDAKFVLWGRATASAGSWKPYHTILLLSSPGFRVDRESTLSISSATQVDVDPRIEDAEWLRRYAQRVTMREAVNVPFPEGGEKLFIAESRCTPTERSPTALNAGTIFSSASTLRSKIQIGTLIDESGAISSGKLVLSAQTWEQFLGRTAKQLAESSVKQLRDLEARLLFLRVTLLFGWSEKVGRLCVMRLWSH
ncbi:MAG: hypothetical protein Q9174_001649 [Haloplaca sp. 1 TL-2023]